MSPVQNNRFPSSSFVSIWGVAVAGIVCFLAAVSARPLDVILLLVGVLDFLAACSISAFMFNPKKFYGQRILVPAVFYLCAFGISAILYGFSGKAPNLVFSLMLLGGGAGLVDVCLEIYQAIQQFRN